MTENALSRSIFSGNDMGQHYIDPNHDVVRRSVRLVRETDAKRVLDLACGRGIVSLALARETEIAAVTAIDINESAIEELNETAQKEKLPIQGVVFDVAAAEGYPDSVHPSGTADVVIAKDIFPFLDPTQVLSMIDNTREALSPQGWLLITAPSTRSRLYQESVPTENHLYRRIGPSAKKYIQTNLDYFTFSSIHDMTQMMNLYNIDMVEATHYGREKGWIMAVGQKIAYE